MYSPLATSIDGYWPNMFSRFIGVLLLLSAPVPSFPQSTATITSESDLGTALLKLPVGDEAAALALLGDHKSLVTPAVCNTLLQAATLSSGIGKSERALFFCELGKTIARQLADKRLLAFAQYKTGRVRFERGDARPAIEDYLLSKTIFEETGSSADLVYVLSELGAASIFVADYDKANQYSVESLKLAESSGRSKGAVGAMPDEYGPAIARMTLGLVAKWRGDYESAMLQFNQSRVLWRKLGQTGFFSDGNIADALIEISHVYQAIGNHQQAISYLSQGMVIAKSLLDKRRMAAVLNDIGVMYIEQGDYRKAREFLNNSLTIFGQINNKRECARNLLNLGVADFRERDYKTALKEFGDSLSRAEAIDAAEIIIAAQEGLGSVYEAEGDYRTALEWFDKAWSVAEKIGDQIRMTEIQWRRAEVFLFQKAYSSARTAASAAADLAERMRSPLLAYLSLTTQGRVLRAQGEHGAAARPFARAIEAIEQMGDEVAGGEKEQQLFFEDKLSPYHELVSLMALENPEAALRFAERAKGRVLLNVLRNGRITVNKSMSQSEQADERRLYGEMVSLNTQLRGEKMRPKPDSTRIAQIEASLATARSSYEVFQTKLYAAHPNLAVKRGQLPAFSLDDARGIVADSRTAILEYVVTEGETFLFVLSKGASHAGVALKVYSIRISKSELAAMVERYRGFLSANHPGFYDTGRRLYDLLVKPAEAHLGGKKTICVVPDGPLWNLPFQALQTGEDKFLLELYALYYAPSIQVLREMRKKSDSLHALPFGKRADAGTGTPGAPTQDLYALGNPKLREVAQAETPNVRNNSFAALPETETEVQSLAAEVYGPSASLVRLGVAAREDLVKAESSNYRVLHFATHGVFDNRSPLYSYIALAPSADGKEDGFLEAWELMEMDLKADLAVLSACDTARGRVGYGEGMIGMTWALFVAGVPTTVASQWRVPSQSTTMLMTSFHKNLVRCESDSSKAEALRKAAMEMINDPRYRMKPYYWAGFVVLGDGGN